MATVPEVRRAEVPPRDGVLRLSLGTVRAANDDGDGDGLTLDGYAAVFNRETVIDSWEGRFRERIAPGAMKKSFRENPPVVQFDHGYHPMIGSIPIGSLRTIVEDVDPVRAPEGGAHVVARLHDNWLVEPVRDAIESGAVNGMSFRFSVLDETWHDADGKRITDPEELAALLRRSWQEDVSDDELLLRTLKQLRVPELGPVVFPAYEDTSVGVRSKLTIDLGRLGDADQRKSLARAVFLADAAQRSSRAGGAPPVTVMADGHAAELTDTPQATDVTSAGGHGSAPSRGSRPIDMWVRKARDTVLNIDAKGRRL